MGLRPAYIYKIVPISTPVTSPIPDRLPLSVLDESDGFIHLSTAVQVPATAGRFFVQETSLQILRLTYDKVENKIRWEDSKGTAPGEIGGERVFPHLYNDGKLGADEVEEAYLIERNPDQTWERAFEEKADWLVY